MKKFFTLIAAVAMAASVNAQTISFDTPYSKGTVPASFSNEGLVLTVTDTDGKMAVDANSQYFGDADSQVQFKARLKTGGKSSSKCMLTLTLPTDGTLKLYARSASSSEARPVILTQNGTELLNKNLSDDDAVKVTMSIDDKDTEKSVFPVVSVAAKQGDVVITYPTNGINIYGIELVSGTTSISNVNTFEASSDSATYNLAGQQVSDSYKGIVIKNGKKYVK